MYESKREIERNMIFLYIFIKTLILVLRELSIRDF